MLAAGVKLDVKSFEGTADIHGTRREVAYAPAIDDIEPSCLVIKGLSIDDAIHVLKSLEGGLLKGDDAKTNASVTPEPKKETKPKESKPKEAPKVIETKAEEKKVEAKAEPKSEPKVETKVEVIDESDDISDDLGDEADGELDVPAMAKMEKLRAVIEHMISRGLKTPKEIIDASKNLIDQVPAFKEVEAKGNFEKRMERAALVVIGGDQAS